jgi:hypothetical protein
MAARAGVPWTATIISYVSGTVTVNPAPLTATVSGTESTNPPTFAVSSINYTGIISPDTSAVVNGILSCDVVVAGGPVFRLHNPTQQRAPHPSRAFREG